MIKNAARFGSGNSVGFIFNFFGITCIMVATSGLGYIYLTNFA